MNNTIYVNYICSYRTRVAKERGTKIKTITQNLFRLYNYDKPIFLLIEPKFDGINQIILCFLYLTDSL